MKNLVLIMCLFFCVNLIAQKDSTQKNVVQDSTKIFKKRVLESTEIDILGSYYTQSGTHSSVGGGIGTEELADYTPTIVVKMPLNDDNVLTIDAGISAYTSASSSNINPFDATGASGGDGEGDDRIAAAMPKGSPWIESSGESQSDVLSSINTTYSHSSDDRNNVYSLTGAFAIEYDYYSIGFGGSYAKLFNEKNTEISAKANVYLDQWNPLYPTELEEFAVYGANFQNEGYFQGVTVFDQNGSASTGYSPIAFSEFNNINRNTFSLSLGFSQILSKKAQFSAFLDVIHQEGLLSTPYHRVYFADQPNYYIGQNATDVAVYETTANTTVYQLADDTEKLPSTRFKTPIGARFNYYINEIFSLRSYYRFYSDNWGVTGHTASLEIPIKVSQAFTLYPTYRYYSQTAADYFAPYETHLSTSKFYTSDYDLSKFNSNQYGLGVKYNDIFTKFKVFKFGLKTINLRYNHYDRSDGLQADIISFGFTFTQD